MDYGLLIIIACLIMFTEEVWLQYKVLYGPNNIEIFSEDIKGNIMFPEDFKIKFKRPKKEQAVSLKDKN